LLLLGFELGSLGRRLHRLRILWTSHPKFSKSEKSPVKLVFPICHAPSNFFLAKGSFFLLQWVLSKLPVFRKNSGEGLGVSPKPRSFKPRSESFQFFKILKLAVNLIHISSAEGGETLHARVPDKAGYQMWWPLPVRDS
jgi:hypothetical protein